MSKQTKKQQPKQVSSLPVDVVDAPEAAPEAEAPEAVVESPVVEIVQPKTGLRLDGPTLAEYVAAGYDAANYPPAGYAAKSERGQMDGATDLFGNPSNYKPLFQSTVSPGASIL